MLRKQASFFPSSKTFDYSEVVTNEGIMKLDSFYDPKLVIPLVPLST